MTTARSRPGVLGCARVFVVAVTPVALLLAGVSLAWMHITQGPSTQRVHIRWAPTVTASERIRAERDAGLVDAEFLDGRTWQYFLGDRSPENVQRLIADPRVEDTFHIDRRTYRVQLDRPDLSPILRRWIESDRLHYVSFASVLLAILIVWWSWSWSVIVTWSRRAIVRPIAAMFPLIYETLGPMSVVFVANTALFTIGFRAFLAHAGGGDFDSHLELARRLDLLHVTAPHFLFEILVRAIVAVGLSYNAAAILVMGLCYGVMGVLIAGEIDRRSSLTVARAVFLIPATLLACQVFVLTVASHDLYKGYLVPIAYHNPTQQVIKVFAIWIIFLFVPTFVARTAFGWRTGTSIGVLCALSAVAKPSFLIAFLPTVALWVLTDFVRLSRTRLLRLAATVVVPSVVVLLWQARIAYGSQAAASVVIAPFAVVNPWEIPLKFSMSLAFPIVVAVAALRTRTWNTRMAFVWVFIAVAIAICLLLAEGGDRMHHGNFMWTGQTATFVAYVESMLFLIATPLSDRWKRLLWAVFASHVLCGALWYALLFTPYWHYFTRL